MVLPVILLIGAGAALEITRRCGAAPQADHEDVRSLQAREEHLKQVGPSNKTPAALVPPLRRTPILTPRLRPRLKRPEL